MLGDELTERGTYVSGFDDAARRARVQEFIDTTYPAHAFGMTQEDIDNRAAGRRYALENMDVFDGFLGRIDL